MLITAVEPRRKGLSSLYIDGEEAFRLDSEVLLAFRFDVGREITDEQLKEVKDASDSKRCKDKAMWLLSFRDHSRRELFDKLRRDYPADTAQKAVQRCEELGLIDDARFARRYSADLFNLKHLSRKGVRQKLKEKGIDQDVIEEVLDEYDVDEDEQIRAILSRMSMRSFSDEKQLRRIYAKLIRMGYSYAAVRSALDEYTDTEESYE